MATKATQFLEVEVEAEGGEVEVDFAGVIDFVAGVGACFTG